MKRRNFIPVAAAAPGVAASSDQSPPASTVPGGWNPRLAESVSTLDEPTLRWVAQLGLKWVALSATESIDIGRKGYWSMRDIENVRGRCDAFSLRLHSLRLPAAWLDAPRLGNDERDRAIENVCTSLVAAGEAGVAVVEWPWSAEARWGSDNSSTELLHRLAYFGERVMGPAEQAGVKMALRPSNARPTGLPSRSQVFVSIEQVEDFFDTITTPANGITMSQQTIPGMEIDLIGAIRRIGGLGRIHHAEFPSEGIFPARGDSEGYPNGLAVMRAYKESGYDLAIVSDHLHGLPTDLGEPRIECSYAHGYIRGLVQAVNA